LEKSIFFVFNRGLIRKIGGFFGFVGSNETKKNRWAKSVVSNKISAAFPFNIQYFLFNTQLKRLSFRGERAL
jgi:hypothetical protein